MKTTMLLAGMALATVGMVSCTSGESKLASQLEGTWQGETMSMTKGMKAKEGKKDRAARPDMGEMTCTPTFTFTRTQGTNGGTIDLAGAFSLTKNVETIATDKPVVATVTGDMTASGTWMAKDDDEIIITLNPEKTVVNVDTTGLKLAYTTFTDAPSADLEAIREKLSANVADVVTPMLSAQVQKLRELDDIKITGTTMTAEVNHTKVVLNKAK